MGLPESVGLVASEVFVDDGDLNNSFGLSRLQMRTTLRLRSTLRRPNKAAAEFIQRARATRFVNNTEAARLRPRPASAFVGRSVFAEAAPAPSSLLGRRKSTLKQAAAATTTMTIKTTTATAQKSCQMLRPGS